MLSISCCFVVELKAANNNNDKHRETCYGGRMWVSGVHS